MPRQPTRRGQSKHQAPPRGAAAKEPAIPAIPLHRAWLASLVVLVSACGGADAPSTAVQPVASVTFTVHVDTIHVGDREVLDVVLRDANGRQVSDAAVAWSSDDPSVATVDRTGTATGRATGEARVTAASNGASASMRLVVRQRPVASLTVDGVPDTLPRGSSVQIAATVRDAAGTVLHGRSVTFASSDAAVAAVSSSGILTGVGVGESDVTAHSEGKSHTVRVRVAQVPVATLEIVPAIFDAEVGGTVQLSSVQRAADGRVLPVRPVEFTSSDAAVATVSGSGFVTAIGAGAASIVATVEGATATVPVTVAAVGATPAPEPVQPPVLPATNGDGSYTIATRWGGTVDGRADAVVAAAVARWGTVITGDLADVVVDVPADACWDGQEAERVTVDDLLIFVRVLKIDGPNGTLARAGPCYVRSGSQLPVIGVVELDVADLDRSQSTVQTVLVHEIGHVLGIGTLWKSLGLLHGTSGDDPLFLGATALGEFHALGGGAFVPVENTGGSGTRLGHWREAAFHTELMTGWIGSGANPMSAMTVASLRDLGYRVNPGAADAYALPAASAVNPRVAGGAGVELVDELFTPRYVVEPGGRARRVR